jgi:hypothetical protein
MSRTDKTKPYHALFLEQNASQEYHDHSVGECDILPLNEWVDLLKNSQGQVAKMPNCGWKLKNSYIAEHPTCGCNLCTESYQHKLERRKERHSTKQSIKKNLKN